MRLSSSPPRGPISVSHSRPCASNARPYGLRWPELQVSEGVRLGPGQVKLRPVAVFAVSVFAGGLVIVTVEAPVRPAAGLPGAGLPSSVRWRIFPSGWLGSCAGVNRCRSPLLREKLFPAGGDGVDAA